VRVSSPYLVVNFVCRLIRPEELLLLTNPRISGGRFWNCSRVGIR